LYAPHDDRTRHCEERSDEAIHPSTLLAADPGPRQFRTRNNLIETQRTRSTSTETAARSTNPIKCLPLITVWLQACWAHQQINGLVGTISRTREATTPETQCFAPTIVRAAWYPSLELPWSQLFHRKVGGTVVRNGEQAICTWV
jgi:hypothetical protein